MSALAFDIRLAFISHAAVTDDSLIIDLDDGRTISLPLAWYLRLLHASEKERSNWRVIGKGLGIHWPDLDEDISVENILTGRPSGEGPRSFKQWLEKRQKDS